jgi:DNA-binding transcriptional ArsR family regulator
VTKPKNVTPMTRYVGIVGSTGEVIDIEAPAIRGRRRRSKRKMYAMVDLESLRDLELTASEYAVLSHVMGAVNAETNEASITLAEIADQLRIAESGVARTMKSLRDRNIVVTRRQGVHRVNSHIMFRGSNQDWDIATDTEKEPVWKR